jgi:excisionase family DNA binding protein
MAKKEKALTVKEVANHLGVTDQTIRTWLKRGRFPGARLEETPLGSYWLIPQAALNGFSRRDAGRPAKASKSGKKGSK